MKKINIMVIIIAFIGIVCSNMMASWYLFNQPETPSILAK